MRISILKESSEPSCAILIRKAGHHLGRGEDLPITNIYPGLGQVPVRAKEVNPSR